MVATETKPIGEQLRELRLRKRLTLREVAQECGDELSWQALGRIEQGGRLPRGGTLITLSRALGVRFIVDDFGIHIEHSAAL